MEMWDSNKVRATCLKILSAIPIYQVGASIRKYMCNRLAGFHPNKLTHLLAWVETFLVLLFSTNNQGMEMN